ncbi:MAG: hypothetical protein WCC90_21875 [Methylocella sp.]
MRWKTRGADRRARREAIFEAKRGSLRCPACFLVQGVILRGFACGLTRCPRTFIDIQPSNKVETAALSILNG